MTTTILTVAPVGAAITLTRTDFAVGASPRQITAADFNNDGRVDLAVANNDSDNVSVLFNTGNGSNFTRTNVSVTNGVGAGQGPFGITSADLDKDGDIDIATANDGDFTVTVIRNTGVPSAPFPAAGLNIGNFGRVPTHIRAADFNQDTNPDLAVTYAEDNSVVILVGDGLPTMGFQGSFVASTGDRPLGFEAPDIGNDGDPDLVVANGFDSTLTVQIDRSNAASSPQWDRHDFDVGREPQDVAVGDLDGDSDPDLALSNRTGDDVTVMRNLGDGTAYARTEFAVGNRPQEIDMADVDGDGDLDIVVANINDDDITVLRNNGTGTDFARTDIPVGDEPVDVVAADLNGDGAADLAVVNEAAGTVSVLRSLPVVTVTPSNVAFGPQLVGTASAPDVVTVENDGSAPFSVSAVTLAGSNPGDFLLSSDGCSGRAVAPGGACTVLVRFAPAASGVRSAEMRLVHSGPDGTTVVPLTGTGAETADLAVSMAALSSPVESGDTLTYRVTVENHGPDPATGVRVHHTLPSNAGFVSTSGCSTTLPPGNTGTMECVIGSLNSGGQVSFATTVEVYAPPGSSVRSTASVSGFTSDPTQANNDATLDTPVTEPPPPPPPPPPPTADMSVGLAASADTVRSGDLVTYTAVLQNNGPDAASGRRLTLSLPSVAKFRSASTSLGTCSTPPVGFTGTVSCTYEPSGGAGSVRTLEVVVTLHSSSTITVQATASGSSDATDPDGSNNSATVSTTIKKGGSGKAT